MNPLRMYHFKADGCLFVSKIAASFEEAKRLLTRDLTANLEFLRESAVEGFERIVRTAGLHKIAQTKPTNVAESVAKTIHHDITKDL